MASFGRQHPDPETEVGYSDEREVGVNRKGTLEDQSSVCSVED